MAVNIRRGNTEPHRQRAMAVSHPTTPASGDPVRFGEYVGTAQTDEDADGNTTVLFACHEAEFSVKGINAGGNVAVALFDDLYYTDADTPPISKKATGRYVGIALETITSGATATIRVLVRGFGGQ